MGKKKNPGYWERRAEYRRNTPICRHCGKHNAAGDHKMCWPQTPAGKAWVARQEQEEADRIQARLDAATWDHLEAQKQRQLVEAKYGERPASIADYWSR